MNYGIRENIFTFLVNPGVFENIFTVFVNLGVLENIFAGVRLSGELR